MTRKETSNVKVRREGERSYILIQELPVRDERRQWQGWGSLKKGKRKAQNSEGQKNHQNSEIERLPRKVKKKKTAQGPLCHRTREGR